MLIEKLDTLKIIFKIKFVNPYSKHHLSIVLLCQHIHI